MALSRVLLVQLFLIALTSQLVCSQEMERSSLSEYLETILEGQVMSAFGSAFQQNLEKEGKLKFLDSEVKTLNISDFTLNAALYIAQKTYPFTMTVLNDDKNPLPLKIDSQSLALLVDELGKITPNRDMSLRLYSDPTIHQVPRIVSDIDGNSLNLQLGLEFGVFYDSEKPEVVLDMDLSAQFKIGYAISSDMKLTIQVLSIKVKEINIKTDALKVNKDLLYTSLTGFFKIAVDGIKGDITNIDVLGKIQKATTATFSSFDILPKFGSTLFKLRK